MKRNWRYSNIIWMMSDWVWYFCLTLHCVKELISSGDTKERGQEISQSFGKYLLERQKELNLSDNETAYLAGSMFGAGSDTTASGISISIMAAACHPKAQAKVREELDNVIGKERGESNLRIWGCGFMTFLAPTLADQEMLPQTTAFVLETFRWRPVSAGGMCIECRSVRSSWNWYTA